MVDSDSSLDYFSSCVVELSSLLFVEFEIKKVAVL
jgi:hypothetical protein